MKNSFGPMGALGENSGMFRPSGILIILLLVSASAFAQSSSEPNVILPTRLHIRAVMDKTVTTKKAKVGDPVRMTVLAPEMEGKTVLIAKDAHLIGRVAESTPYKGPGTEARLMVVVERAEWRKHSVPLNAYIVAQGAIRTQAYFQDWPCRLGSRDYQRCLEEHPEQKGSGRTTISDRESPTLPDVELLRVGGPDGPTALVCNKHDIVLTDRTAVLLHNITN